MSLLIMDTFKGQDNDEMRKFCAKNSCEIVIIPHNLTNRFRLVSLRSYIVTLIPTLNKFYKQIGFNRISFHLQQEHLRCFWLLNLTQITINRNYFPTLTAVWNRATWDTSQRLRVNFFGHFYIPFYIYILDLKNYKLSLWEVIPRRSISYY